MSSATSNKPPMPVVGNGRDANGRLLPGVPKIPGSGRSMGLAKKIRAIVDFDKAIATLVDIAWGRLAATARPADRIKAIELLMDRGYGKAHQTVDITDGESVARGFAPDTRTERDLLALRDTIRRALDSSKPIDVPSADGPTNPLEAGNDHE